MKPRRAFTLDWTSIAGWGAVFALLGAGWAYVKRQRGASSTSSSSSSTPATSPLEDDPIVAPAYPYLATWTTAQRRALYQLQKDLGLDIRKGGLPGIFQHESGGDPTAPHEATGTPRGGLIQITRGARLPGFDTDEKVWAVRAMSIDEQLERVVRPFFARMKDRGDGSLTALMRRNFLPGAASKSSDFVLGVKPAEADKPAPTGPGGELATDLLLPGLSSLTRGQIYTANPGFRRGRDWFTWGDADASAAITAARAGGKWTTASGKIVDQEPNA